MSEDWQRTTEDSGVSSKYMSEQFRKIESSNEKDPAWQQ